MLTLVCAAVLATPASGASIGKRNSVPVAFRSVTPIEAQGASCASTATGSTTLAPARRGVSKAFGITVVKPNVGDLDQSGFARVTSVAVSDQTIAVAMVVNDRGQCTEGVGWKARFEPDITFFRRIQARVRPDAWRKPAKLAPRTMRLQSGDSLRRIRWKRYGAKKTIGTARYDFGLPGCTPKKCLGHKGRVKVRLRRVRACQDSGIFEFTRLAVFFRGRMLFETGNIC